MEEVIVGRVKDSIFPQKHISLLGGAPEEMYNLMKYLGGLSRRPEKINHFKKYKTLNWSSRCHTSACPRDCFLIIGNEIIEAPMSWRNRYFEKEVYYTLFKEYFDQGAKWTSAHAHY